MDGWMDGPTVHAQGTPSYTVYGPEADFFSFLFVCHMKFTSPFQFHPPLLFIEYLPTVPYGQVHETTYLLVCVCLPTSYIRSGLGNTGMT